ncbi:MAG: TauD/TfdA dioxygenase family protein [Paracoccaceae bacterium]
MRTTPLHPDFGVEILDFDLSNVREDSGYPEIRAAFEEHSLLLFRAQTMDDDDILRLGRCFGEIENRTDGPISVPRVSNVLPDGSVLKPDAMRLKDLKSNMLWHTDSTFLPTPALANIITARIVPSEGGATELVSTRAGFARLPETLKEKARCAKLRHALAHSRAKIDPDLAKAAHIAKWEATCWPAVWTNPVHGKEALYIASHAFAVDGMDDAEGQALIDHLIELMVPENAIYSHQWRVGDVLIWDERATLHRGMPWPYEQARELASICVTASDDDGVTKMRAA